MIDAVQEFYNDCIEELICDVNNISSYSEFMKYEIIKFIKDS